MIDPFRPWRKNQMWARIEGNYRNNYRKLYLKATTAASGELEPSSSIFLCRLFRCSTLSTRMLPDRPPFPSPACWTLPGLLGWSRLSSVCRRVLGGCICCVIAFLLLVEAGRSWWAFGLPSFVGLLPNLSTREDGGRCACFMHRFCVYVFFTSVCQVRP